METFDILHIVSSISILLPIFISIIRFRFLDNVLRTLSYLLFLSLLFEIIIEFTVRRNINNLPFLHLFTIVEFSFLGLIFYKVFTHPLFKKAIIVTIIAFAAFAVINALFIQTLYEFNTIARAVESFLLILLALLFFYKIFRESVVVHLGRYPMFWISSGILVYFSGSFFLFIFSNYILEQPGDMLYSYWGIHSVLNIFLNLFFAMGLWYSSQK